jgi:hypothetical protein
VQVNDTKNAVFFFLQFKRLPEHAQVIAHMQGPGWLDAAKDAHS